MNIIDCNVQNVPNASDVFYLLVKGGAMREDEGTFWLGPGEKVRIIY